MLIILQETLAQFLLCGALYNGAEFDLIGVDMQTQLKAILAYSQCGLLDYIWMHSFGVGNMSTVLAF